MTEKIPNFVKFERSNFCLDIDIDQIRVKGDNIYLGRLASKKFPEGGRVDIFIDKENSLIKIVPGTFKKLYKGVYTYGIKRVHFNMPDGLYLAEEDFYRLIK